jgi:hypothetical protein
MNRYSVTDLGGLPDGPNGTCTPFAISSQGKRITGTALSGTGSPPFIWNPFFGRHPVGLPSPTEMSGIGYTTNSRGDVAGTYGGLQRAFLTRNGGAPIDISSQLGGSPFSSACGMNETGDVVGYMSANGEVGLNDSGLNGWIFTDDGAINLTTAVNSEIATASDINGSRRVIGRLASDKVYIYDVIGGVFKTLSITAKKPGTLAGGPFINDNGQIAVNATDGFHYLAQGDYLLSFNQIGGPAFAIAGLNDSGQVVASDGTDIFISDPIDPLQTQTSNIYSVNGLLDTSGWVVTNAYGVDNDGAIIGTGHRVDGDRAGQPRGVLLARPVLPKTHQAAFAEILFGIINDGSGVEIPRGKVPPFGPNMRELSSGQLDALLGLAIGAGAELVTDRVARSELQAVAARLVREASERLTVSQAVANAIVGSRRDGTK